MMRRLRKAEKGIAMITVIFVGAVLVVVGSTAAVMAVSELRTGGNDRKAAEALGYAEAGIDRLVLELKRGSFTWGDIREAGCERPALSLPVGTIGGGTFQAELVVYNPNATDEASRWPPVACAARPDVKEDQFFAITSIGSRPTAKRVVKQVVKIGPVDVPMGVSGDRIDANGSGSMFSISLLSPGDVTGREKMGFTGMDPYYSLGDFYPGLSTETPIPSAVHAAGAIYFISGGKNRQEHPPSPNCTANSAGALGQSLWDGSGSGVAVGMGCAGQTGWPPTAAFTSEDYERLAQDELDEQNYITLREAARSSGLYCTQTSGGTRTCFVAGTPHSMSTVTDADLAGLPANFVAFFDFASGTDPLSNANRVRWKANVGPCSDDSSTNRSVTLVIRNGSLTMENGSTLTGAALVPEGDFDSAGSFETHGAIIAKQVRIRGNSSFRMSDCWVRNMPSALLDVTPVHWSELDR